MSASTDAVNAPPLDADPALLVDWLELVAFFSRSGVARMDEIDNSITIQEQEHASDNATADAERDERRSGIEEEVNARTQALGEAYPFYLSDDGEELIFKARGERRGAGFYLSCLIISHFTRSRILATPPTDDAAANVRKRQFQTLATLAVSGHIDGPAISFGWPRATGESITDAITRCCELSGTGSPKIPPGPEASKFSKDGGMDVIAWKPAVDGNPPPAVICFGQAASGHGWRSKSAADELSQFYRGYFAEEPACSPVSVTVVPFRLQQDDHDMHARRHGHLLDRLRTPKAALKGLRLACEDGVLVDEVNRVWGVNSWVMRYRRSLQAA